MNFFLELEREQVALDMVLVDGNHDYEFALFDLQMAAKLLRSSGIIVMDNAEQNGPFHASRVFLGTNPAWRELGNGIASYNPSNPFKQPRASIIDTSFVILQAPAHLAVGANPHSWGQARTNISTLDGFSLDLPAQVTAGTLHYQAILRVFAAGARDIVELKGHGGFRLDLDGPATTSEYRLEAALHCDMRDAEQFTFEIELAWQADAGAPPLSLAALPTPIGGVTEANPRLFRG